MGMENIILNNIKPTDKEFITLENLGDGHCFYYTILRFIKGNEDYFDTITTKLDGDDISISDLARDFNPNIDEQNPKAVINIRKALIQFALDQGDDRFLDEN